MNRNHAPLPQSTRPAWLSALVFWGAVITTQVPIQAHAATIYPCKQASGKVAFQEFPCAHNDAQEEVGKTTHAAPPPPAKSPASASSKAETTPKAEAARPANDADPLCRKTGTKVFDASLPQHLQHPQASFNMCKKALPEPQQRNSACVNACVESWIAEYKKQYLDKNK